ncbi:unnamed protein product [Leptidea sinapis]|uniref:Uncharacterized protein n=1 Tax=Leptidea sinapis TaxID=189913 RepID=A0A5E4QBX6_9NEOP|nr:unnamed protein product [Leptidea sinapis]
MNYAFFMGIILAYSWLHSFTEVTPFFSFQTSECPFLVHSVGVFLGLKTLSVTNQKWEKKRHILTSSSLDTSTPASPPPPVT